MIIINYIPFYIITLDQIYQRPPLTFVTTTVERSSSNCLLIKTRDCLRLFDLTFIIDSHLL